MSRKAANESAEDRLIARHFKPLATDPGAFGLVDDAAIMTPPAGHDVVLKTDAIVGTVHFFADDPADMVAKKALRVNLSDLAAKGASPAGFLLSLVLPKEIGDEWLAGFAAGLKEDAETYGCPLFGGDTDHTPGPVTIAIAAFGTVPHGKMVLRSGARPGDRIVATGTIGDAAIGLLLRRDSSAAKRWRLDRRQHEHLLSRYLLPQPRNALAEPLRRFAHAAMDVSDGLVGDLNKLCRASGVAADIEVARVPLSDAVRKAVAAEPSLAVTALTGGDDYEILAAVPERALPQLTAAAEAVGVPLTEIGRIGEGEGARVLDPDGRPLFFAQQSYSHF